MKRVWKGLALAAAALVLSWRPPAAFSQVPETGLLKKLGPFLPLGTVTRGFTYIDVADRPEYIYDYTVGAVQSRVVLVQKDNPRLYMLVPHIDEDAIRNTHTDIHDGYVELLAEKDGKLSKVFDSHDAFGERLLNHTEIGFADLDGKGCKDVVFATQFGAENGQLASSTFVFAWDPTDERFRKVVRERQPGDWAAGLRLVPTQPGSVSRDIFVTRPGGSASTRDYWWLYGYANQNVHVRAWQGPVPGKSWIAMIGPQHTYRVITARWIPMDTPKGRFLDKSEVTIWRRVGNDIEPAEKYFTFHDPYELTREVPRDVPIPDDLWPYYFSSHLIDHLPRRTWIEGQVTYPLFPEKARVRSALNFMVDNKPYTALAYVLWRVKNVGDPNPVVDQYLHNLAWPHQVADQIEGGTMEVTPKVQIKVMAPHGSDYKELWTSPPFPEGHVFDGFEVEDDTLYAKFTVHGEPRRAPLPFLRGH